MENMDSEIKKQRVSDTILLIAIAVILYSVFASVMVQAADLEGLGDLPGGSFYSDAYAVSADGTVVVGTSKPGASREAFRWTSADGMIGLGTLGGDSYGYGISDDGSVVVGISYTAGSYRAPFLWENGVMTNLGYLPGGSNGSANAVSGDGLVVVGTSQSAASGLYSESFRWTAGGGMQSLGTLPGSGFYRSEARGVNSDGSVVVGRAKNASNSNEAYRWTAGGGMAGLGFLTGGAWSDANAVNGDGSVVVGSSGNSDGYDEAFRWENNSMTGLGFLDGSLHSYANAVNSDGTVIVGNNENDDDYTEAFHWTAATGMQSLAEWLADSGYTLTGWSEMTASGVSDDGTVVVGQGNSANGQEAYIARGGSGLISINDLSASLGSTSSMSAQGAQTAQTILHGAHGHPGATRALDEKYTMWVAGDLSHDDRHDSKDDSHLGEIGLSYKYSDQLSLSLALGKTGSDSDLIYSGSSDSDGKYFAVDTDIKLTASSPLFLTLTYLQGENDVDIKRGYENAGSLDASYANTDQSFRAYRSRLQWQSAKSINSSNFHPYIEYNSVKLKTDGYTETGGGFPAVINGTSETISDWRIGFDADYEVNTKNRILYTLEGVNRTSNSGNGVSGNVIGLFAFDIDGREYKQNWLRGTLGLEHTFDNKGRITVTLNSSTSGEDPQYWTGVNYSIGF